MKKYILSYVVVPIAIGMSCLSLTAFSQSVPDSTLLGLPGDNLDLYAVLDLFQNSKTIEDFEKSLNLEKTGINNMDLDLDKKVDFIKVVTKQDKDDFTFVLQINVSEKETQDVAVILVSKDDKKKITMQIVGDEALYGKNHIVELKESSTPAVTANPGYKGPDTVKVVTAPAKTTTVIVEQAPIVQYVYSPAYVPYVPPYYYGFYPPYFAAFSVMAMGMYWGAHAHYHYGGYGYHGNTVIINNNNNFNNYNRTRNTSNTVNNNMRGGNYKRDNAASTRPSNRESSRPSASTREAGGSPSDRKGGASASTREAGPTRDAARNSPSTRQAGGAGPTREAAGQTPSNRQSGVSTQPSRSSSNGASRYSGGGSRGNSSYSGGGYSGGASRGGGFSGGGARGGGGRRR